MARKHRIPEAAALRYEEGHESAPVVVASGKGVLAERIVEIAREAQIPVVEDAAEATLLGRRLRGRLGRGHAGVSVPVVAGAAWAVRSRSCWRRTISPARPR